MGYTPMPLFEEAVLRIPVASNEYPLLMTNAKEEVYMGSSYFHVASIRNMRPHPVVEMNPETANKLGLADGDWVTIETAVGSCRQKLSFNKDVDPRVVIATFNILVAGATHQLYGWNTLNLNMVTPSGPDYDPLTGAVTLKGVPCRVYLAGNETNGH
jgi:anaerobic selenocysteine-containing dehydrogenase